MIWAVWYNRIQYIFSYLFLAYVDNVQQFRQSVATILKAGIDTVQILNKINITYIDDNDSVGLIDFPILVTTTIIIAYFIEEILLKKIYIKSNRKQVLNDVTLQTVADSNTKSPVYEICFNTPL